MSALSRDRLGQGPESDLTIIDYTPQDTLLRHWSDWIDHDGAGLPTRFTGRRVWIAGLMHDRTLLQRQDVLLNDDYLASKCSHLWDWSKGYGGISRYRLRRAAPLPFDQDQIDLLNRYRRRCPSPELMLGLDGVQG